MTAPPLLIYQQTIAALLCDDPRPGPRHALRASPRPDLRRMFMQDNDDGRAPREFTQDDGSVYERVDPAAFGDYDEVDSRDIVDGGAPVTDDDVLAAQSVPDGEH